MKTLRYLTIAALALLLAACGTQLQPEQQLELAAASSASLRAVHASPDAPAVDVVVVDADGNVAARLFENLAYGNASAERLTGVPAGDYTIGVTLPGQVDVLYQQDVTLGTDDYTVVATGYYTPDGGAPGFRFEAYATDLSPVRPGKVRVQAIHGAPALPAALVDVYLSRPDKKLSAIDPVEDFAFTDDLTVELRPGDHRVRIAVADTTLVAIDSGTVTLPNRGILTLVAIGIPEDGGLSDFGLVVIAE